MSTAINDVQLTQADHNYLLELSDDESFNTIFAWLAGNDSTRRQFALKLVSQFGKAVTDKLLAEAFGKGKSPKQRVRLLAAIEEIGEPLDTNQWMLLVFEARRFSGVVAKQIAQLMVWNRQLTTGAAGA